MLRGLARAIFRRFGTQALFQEGGRWRARLGVSTEQLVSASSIVRGSRTGSRREVLNETATPIPRASRSHCRNLGRFDS